jgi:hypothetical protein
MERTSTRVQEEHDDVHAAVPRLRAADPRGTSWQAAGTRRSFLLNDGDAVRVGAVEGRRAAASATFLVR